MLFKNMAAKKDVLDNTQVIEVDGLVEAIHESMCDFESNVHGAIPMILSNVYENFVVDNTKTVEEKTVLLEGVITEAFGKIKDFFLRLWNQIKSWFASAVKYLQTIFMTNKQFISKYGSELEGKETGKFTYKGYDWNPSALNTYSSKIASAGKEPKKAFDDAVKTINKSKDVAATSKGYSVDEHKKAIDRAIGSRGVGDFKTELMKAARGRNEKHDITGFKVASVKEMIEVITEGKEGMALLKEFSTVAQDNIASYADEVDKCRSAAEKDSATDRSNKMTYVNNAATVAKYHISYGVAFLDVAKNITKEMISEYSGALRSFARYSPKKEEYELGGEGTPVTEGAKIWETYMQDF